MSRWFVSYGFADVDDGLVVGAYPLDVNDVDVLVAMSVTSVLNLAQEGEYEPGQHAAVAAVYAAAGIEEKRLDIVDYGHLPPAMLEAGVEIVLDWLDRGDGTVYLHCRAGWQRSAAMAAGVVAARRGLDINEALAQVRDRKPTADPLPHQVRDLWAWWDARQESGQG